MRQKNHARPLRFVAGGIIIMLTGILAFSACKKEQHIQQEPPVAKSDMEKAATILNGQLDCRDLETMNEVAAADLKFDKGNKLIILQLKPNETGFEFPSAGNGCIVKSSFGIVINFMTSGTVLLLPNNDKESEEKFEAVESMFNNLNTASVESTTLVNINS